MKILVGGISQETNTFSPFEVKYEDFDQYRGEDLIRHFQGACTLLRNEGYEIIPAVFARIIPSGAMSKEEFMLFIHEMVAYVEKNNDIDGVWLNLHGAMSVKEVGSGEALLVKVLREKLRDNVVISASLDFHGNINEDFIKNVNVITGYRTAPHVDIEKTQKRAVRYLIQCLKEKIISKTYMIRVPIVLPGERVITADEPTRSVIAALENLNENRAGLMDVSLFCGFVWADEPISSSCISYSVYANEQEIHEEIKKIAKKWWESRYEFRYSSEVASPEEAIEKAKTATEAPLFLSDSGDNVTAGASGDNALLTSIILERGLKNTLIGGIADTAAVEYCMSHEVGEKVQFQLGATIDPKGSKAVQVDGILKIKKSFVGDISSSGDMEIAVVGIGDVDVIITNRRQEFTTLKAFEETGVSVFDYKNIVVKLGYLFPELAKAAQRSIIVLTPGCSNLNVEDIEYHRITRPIYPIDKDFTWTP